MNSPSTRIRKRRAPQRQTPDSYQNLPVPLRRSHRLQVKQRTTSIPQSLKHQSTAPQTLHTRLPTSDHINALVPSRAQLQGLPQTHTHQTRKRGPSESIENSSKRLIKRACLTDLTERNLKAFTKLENMRQQSKRDPKRLSRSEPKLSHSESKSSRSESKSFLPNESKSSSKTVSTTDPSFAHFAFENGILEQPNAEPPANLDYKQERLNRTRETVSPTESEYKVAAYKIQTAENEQTVLLETSKLLKDWNVRGYRSVFNQPFKDFPKNVGFNNGLSAAQPDVVEGIDVREFHPFPVRQQLGGAAVPSQGPNAITLPHLAGEWKGPGKDMILAQHQAAYDGASMVFARNEALSFLGSPDPPSYAFISTFTIDSATINTFSHHSSESQGQVNYHQFPTTTTPYLASHKDFKEGRRRLRNEQEDAKINSETLRDELKQKWLANQQEDDEDENNNNEDGYSSAPMSQGIQTKTADPKYCDGYNRNDQEDGEDEPSSQLLTETEYYANFTKDKDEDEDENFVQIPTPIASSLASKPRRKHKKKKA